MSATPLFVITFIFAVVVASFGRYEMGAMLPFFAFPAWLAASSEVNVAAVARKVAKVSPFVVVLALSSVFFDESGWLVLGSIVVKFALITSAVLFYTERVGVSGLASAMLDLRVPQAFVFQLLLLMRYISLLGGEATRLKWAYELRGGSVGIQSFGALCGILLRRTIDRALRVGMAIDCRMGAGLALASGERNKTSAPDAVVFIAWMLFFALARYIDLPRLLGSLSVG